MAALLELVKLFSCERKAEEEFLSCQYKMNEEMFSSLNSSIDIRSSRTFFISSKTVLFAVFVNACVQFVTKVVFFVWQDEGKVLQLCFCP